jgi:hypothetical protein
MTLRAKIEALAAICILVAGALIVRSYLDARADQLRLQATIAAQQGIIASAQQQMQSLDAAAKQRDAQTQATIAAMQQAVARVQTPQQIASWIPPQLPTPVPLAVNIPSPTAANPAPDAIARIPQQDLPAIRDMIESCKECSVKLNAAQQDVASKDQQLRLAGEQLSAMQRERAAALTAAKGGNLWRRIQRNALWFFIGGATAAALGGVAHH